MVKKISKVPESANRSLSSAALAKVLTAKFPVLRKQVAQCQSAYDLASVFATFVNESITTHNASIAEPAIKLAESFYTSGMEDLKNAFYTDFCEVLDLRSDYGRKIFGGMSHDCQKLYCEAQKYIGQPYGK